MSKRFTSKRELGAMADINITPLLDMAFALLIIFIISTPLLEQPVAVQLPTLLQAEEIVREATEDPVQITVDADGNYFLETDMYSLEQLSRILSGYDNNRVFIVRGDRQGPYAGVAEILDLLRNHGLTRVVLSYGE